MGIMLPFIPNNNIIYSIFCARIHSFYLAVHGTLLYDTNNHQQDLSIPSDVIEFFFCTDL